MEKLFLILTLLSTTSYTLPTKSRIDLKLTTVEKLSFKKYCQSDPNSKWIQGRCYYFNKKLHNFEDAKDQCQFHFIYKNQNRAGKLYEPKSLIEFLSMYKIAQEKFTEKSPGFWLGIEDIENEGVFKYASNNQSLLGEWEARLPWASNQPNGGKKENCLTGMRFRWYDYDCSKIAWSICESTSNRFSKIPPKK